MEVEYSFPGPIKIHLDSSDLHSMQHAGFTVERDGFSGLESKTWVHLEPLDITKESDPNNNTADIEPGGDIHVRLARGSGYKGYVEIEQTRITGDKRVVEHYLADGSILVTWPRARKG